MSDTPNKIKYSHYNAQTKITYVIEVRATNRKMAWLHAIYSKYSEPGRIWVRGYDEDDNKVFEETVAFSDTRYYGPRSHNFRMLKKAEKLARELAGKAEAVEATPAD